MLDGKPVEHPPLYWEFHERGFDQAARIGDWKAVKNGPEGPRRTLRPEVGPGETHDVAADHPDVVKRFEAFLKTARVDSPTLAGPRANATKKARAKRRRTDVGHPIARGTA